MNEQRELLKIADKVVDALEQLGTQRHEIISHMEATDVSILDGDDPLGNWSPLDRYLHRVLDDVPFNFDYHDENYLDVMVNAEGYIEIVSGLYRHPKHKVLVYLPDFLQRFDRSEPWRLSA